MWLRRGKRCLRLRLTNIGRSDDILRLRTATHPLSEGVQPNRSMDLPGQQHHIFEDRSSNNEGRLARRIAHQRGSSNVLKSVPGNDAPDGKDNNAGVS